METKRQLKIARLLQKELGEIFQLELKGLTAGSLITVTKVNVAPDLSVARVFLSVFGAKDKNVKVEQVKPHAREIRGLLGNRVRHQLRSIPELKFQLDDSLDYIEKIDNLLKGE
ncbi:MAG: 30S ribosome-binding factor RbfA [Bacteroidales bacterium]|jgi:ribosome-binding factor A|nr:30S ribosome-binding factor RbfA [Bacteroidota bacterium]MDO8896803.1 30S ribosome-binding factor RbfA [Bacteroidales bacterium]MDP2237165.1 30S ribosome-binding factor RbfA [Bacteroidales bacterium]